KVVLRAESESEIRAVVFGGSNLALAAAEAELSIDGKLVGDRERPDTHEIPALRFDGKARRASAEFDLAQVRVPQFNAESAVDLVAAEDLPSGVRFIARAAAHIAFGVRLTKGTSRVPGTVGRLRARLRECRRRRYRHGSADQSGNERL